jgi:hypothetical protein
VRVTVPVDVLLPTRLVGLRASVERAGGEMVSTAVRVTPPLTAEMFALVGVPTADVDTANVTLLEPAATVTLAGTAAAGLSLESVTTAPDAGAAPFKVAVPCEPDPPITDVGLSARVASASGGTTVSDAVWVLLGRVAEMVTVVVADTAVVVMLKVAVVAPPGTVTLAGTEAAPGLLLESGTEVPPAGAAVARVTVPCAVPPPVTLAGLTARESEPPNWYPVMLGPTSTFAPPDQDVHRTS